jgi:hypothetical protein
VPWFMPIRPVVKLSGPRAFQDQSIRSHFGCRDVSNRAVCVAPHSQRLPFFAL